jgi:hypothetical protein
MNYILYVLVKIDKFAQKSSKNDSTTWNLLILVHIKLF